MVQLEEMVELE